MDWRTVDGKKRTLGKPRDSGSLDYGGFNEPAGVVLGFCFWVVEYSRGFFYVWNLKEVCQAGEVSGSSSLLFLSSVFGGCLGGRCAL